MARRAAALGRSGLHLGAHPQCPCLLGLRMPWANRPHQPTAPHTCAGQIQMSISQFNHAALHGRCTPADDRDSCDAGDNSRQVLAVALTCVSVITAPSSKCYSYPMSVDGVLTCPAFFLSPPTVFLHKVSKFMHSLLASFSVLLTAECPRHGGWRRERSEGSLMTP